MLKMKPTNRYRTLVITIYLVCVLFFCFSWLAIITMVATAKLDGREQAFLERARELKETDHDEHSDNKSSVSIEPTGRP